MATTLLLQTAVMTAIDFRCTAGPQDAPFREHHLGFDLAFVRRGSFGYRARGRHAELVAGGFLAGRPGEDFTCTHDHSHGGDECLHLRLSPETVESLGGLAQWPAGALPPHAELMVWGALALAAAEGRSDLGVEEAGLLMASQVFDAVRGLARAPARPSSRERACAVDAALWLASRSGEPLDLAATARRAGLSAFHFLRLFRSVLGVTPHQYLIRCRLARAAQHLAADAGSVTGIAFDCGFNDLSHFVRSFRRAAGMSPRDFRKLARGDRKILQERLAARALA